VLLTVFLLGGSGLSQRKEAEALTVMSQIPGFSNTNALKLPSDPIEARALELPVLQYGGLDI
jgi:hypothetical protein